MPIPFAINGFGRVGRALARIAHQRADLELVAINDRAPASTLARLLRRDSVHGRFHAEVDADADGVGELLRIDGREVRVWRHDTPADIPWHLADTAARPQVVVDASGTALDRQRAAEHLRPEGPFKVVISAISHDADVLICQGLNDAAYDPARHHVVSSGSCTTHCLGLVVDVLDRQLGVERALMNEVHSYTGNQQLVDGIHDDARRGRAAALNIVPTTSAAPAAVEGLLPGLTGRLSGMAIRVPTPDVALLEVVATVRGACDLASLRAIFEDAAQGRLAGLLATSDEPLVSSDHIGDPHSAIIDLELLHCADHHLCRVLAWYDNEWGYANRLADLSAALIPWPP